MIKKITYRQVFDKLKALGYTEQIAELNGHRHRVFLHDRFDRATIYLPFVDPAKPAESYHLAMIRTVLTNHGVIDEVDENELIFR